MTSALTWFRGAADTVALEPAGRSMVVYGENGAGKSSFVDGLRLRVLNGAHESPRNLATTMKLPAQRAVSWSLSKNSGSMCRPSVCASRKSPPHMKPEAMPLQFW